MANEAKRCVTGFSVEWISLVGAPANGKQIILKSQNARPETAEQKEWEFPIVKSDTEKRIVYGLVAVPGEVDTDGDVYTALAVEKAMEQFMASGYTQYVDREHDYNVRDAYVRESWLVKDGDPLFAEAGAWAVGIKICSDDLWEVVKSGKVKGLSLAGWAYETTDPEAYGELAKDGALAKAGKTLSAKTKAALSAAHDALAAALDGLKGLMEANEEKSKKREDEIDMTKEEMQELMKTAMAEAVAPIKEDIDALKKSIHKEPDGAPAAGDGTAATGAAAPEGQAVVKSAGAAKQAPETVSKDDIADIVKSAVSETVKPLQDELDLIKKSGFMRAITEGQGEKVEKSVFAGFGLIPGR